MKLYWWPNTRSFRAVWVFEEVGALYERVARCLARPALQRAQAIDAAGA